MISDDDSWESFWNPPANVQRRNDICQNQQSPLTEGLEAPFMITFFERFRNAAGNY